MMNSWVMLSNARVSSGDLLTPSAAGLTTPRGAVLGTTRRRSHRAVTVAAGSTLLLASPDIGSSLHDVPHRPSPPVPPRTGSQWLAAARSGSRRLAVARGGPARDRRQTDERSAPVVGAPGHEDRRSLSDAGDGAK